MQYFWVNITFTKPTNVIYLSALFYNPVPCFAIPILADSRQIPVFCYHCAPPLRHGRLPNPELYAFSCCDVFPVPRFVNPQLLYYYPHAFLIVLFSSSSHSPTLSLPSCVKSHSAQLRVSIIQCADSV